MAVTSGFFHLAETEITDQRCEGTACFVADPHARFGGDSSAPRIHCLGRCYQAPADGSMTGRPHVAVRAPNGVVLGRVAAGGTRSLAAARATGGYRALELALGQPPSRIVDAVEFSQLRGRGGAGFPTGTKWRAVHGHGARAGRSYVVANADEGDPGAYIDRMILEDDPHSLIEGLAIAALAVGATAGYVYVRREYPQAHAIVAAAVADARSAGILGARMLGTGPPFDIAVVGGEGSYVCGEETALLNALEGRRPEVRARPPYPAASGLHGVPTLVNNVETLAAIPWIVSNGGDAYAAMGAGRSRGTKAVSLNSLFRAPGLYEVEFGLPVRDIVEDLGGGLVRGQLAGLWIGGPLAGILPPHLLDTPFTFEDLRAVGCDVGHGGIVAFDERTTIPALVRHVFRFGAYESCGKCTPCREGTAEIEALFALVGRGERVPPGSASRLRRTIATLGATSLCGHGTGLAAFATSVIAHYEEELDRCLD